MRTRFIGALAAEAGVNPRTLRFYESLGVLPSPKRAANGYRVYDEGAVQRLRFIASAKRLGLRLKEICDILKVWESGRPPCGSVRGVLLQHVEQIDRQIKELRMLKESLLVSLRTSRRGGSRNGMVCSMIERHKAKEGSHQ